MSTLRALVAAAIWWFHDEHLGRLTHRWCCDHRLGYALSLWACHHALESAPLREPDPSDEVEWVAWKLHTDYEFEWAVDDILESTKE